MEYSNDKPLHVGIVVGAASGDILGSGLVAAIKARHPNVRFSGIGGPLMIEQGFESLYPMYRLSVMGLFEVLGRIFELVKIRRHLKRYFLDAKPDVFIGIDAPDFNLGLELQLRQSGIKTAHYVSPSVWAWRQKRVFKIAKAVDLMLTLLPFEARFYKAHDVAVKFVGHPLADLIPKSTDRSDARRQLGLDEQGELIAVLPGSRSGEVERIADPVFSACELIRDRRPNAKFVVPCVNEARKAQIEQILLNYPDLPMQVVLGNSRKVMSAANVVLLASGTATLECMLMKRPMVVAYRLNKFTYWLMQRLLKTPYVSLPNLLANKALVPELIQDAANPDNIAKAVVERLPADVQESLTHEFNVLHDALRLNASEEAADAVLTLIKQ